MYAPRDAERLLCEKGLSLPEELHKAELTPLKDWILFRLLNVMDDVERLLCEKGLSFPEELHKAELTPLKDWILFWLLNVMRNVERVLCSIYVLFTCA